MDIYVYVDNVHIIGDDVDIRLTLPLSEESILCEDGEQLEVLDTDGNLRLNILITEGFSNGEFSDTIKEQLYIYCSFYHNGKGEIYLVWNGNISTITEQVLR